MNKKMMPTIKLGARETGISLTEVVSKEMGLTEAIPKEASVIDTDLRTRKSTTRAQRTVVIDPRQQTWHFPLRHRTQPVEVTGPVGWTTIARSTRPDGRVLGNLLACLASPTFRISRYKKLIRVMKRDAVGNILRC